MEFRNADSRHVDWVKALKQLFQQLKAYVKQHHMAGPSWNPRGIPLTDFKADKNASAASDPTPALASASAPRPPPPGICQHHKVGYPSYAMEPGSLGHLLLTMTQCFAPCRSLSMFVQHCMTTFRHYVNGWTLHSYV